MSFSDQSIVRSTVLGLAIPQAPRTYQIKFMYSQRKQPTQRRLLVLLPSTHDTKRHGELDCLRLEVEHLDSCKPSSKLSLLLEADHCLHFFLLRLFLDVGM
jgi:hypothetical protein